ncbi:hypothetical protein PINS_up010792 [Pythium insidiosum]|nr:hypothetical protein PINS_up010792 [Pythium insidiosum]
MRGASLLDAPPFVDNSETHASTQVFPGAAPRDSDPILLFLEADANHDGVLDASEVRGALVAPMQLLLQRIRADDSLSDSLKATRSQLLQDDIDRKLDCVHRAVNKVPSPYLPHSYGLSVSLSL